MRRPPSDGDEYPLRPGRLRVSKDDGYDPLPTHLKSKGIDARRSATLSLLAAHADDKVLKVTERLRKLGPSRPRRTKSLASTINALFDNALDEQEIEAIIKVLERRGVIVRKEGKVSYAASA